MKKLQAVVAFCVVPFLVIATLQTAQGANNAAVGRIQCLVLPDSDSNFGSVTKDSWKGWVDGIRFTVNPKFLAVEKSQDNRRTLRQKLVPHSNGSERVLAGADLPASRGYRLTQSIYLEPGFEFGGKNEGGKIGFGFGGGSAPSGGLLATDGFTARFMWRGHRDGTAHIAMYSYAADRQKNLPWGDDYPLDGFSVPIGQWFELSMEIIANSSIARSDGSARAWVNGELRMQRENIRWQSSGGKPSVQQLFYAAFYGGNDPSWAPSKTTYIRFADVCWAPVVNGKSVLQPDSSSAQGGSCDAAKRADEQSFRRKSVDLRKKADDSSLEETSARGLINGSLRRIELLLPTENGTIDWFIHSTLDRLNEALDLSHWVSNDEITNESPTVSKLSEAIYNLKEATLVDDAPVFMQSEPDMAARDLALAAGKLARMARLNAEARLEIAGCRASTSSSSGACDIAIAETRQADGQLASGDEAIDSNLHQQAAVHAHQALTSLRAAFDELK